MPDWGPDTETVIDPDATDEPPTIEPPTAEPPTSEPPPGALGRIVFASDRDGNYEIYTMNPDGTDPVRLTENEAEDSQPIWSPDGSKIAIISYQDATYGLAVMNTNGSGQTRLVEGMQIGALSWSPDSSQIAYVDVGSGLNVISASGGVPTLVAERPVSDRGIAWGPGGALAFIRDEPMKGGEVYVLMPGGNNPIRISPEGIPAELLTWSPDGTRLAFAAIPDFSTSKHMIYVADVSGAAPLKLITPNSTYMSDLEWSPDGAWLAFSSFNIDSDNEVYIVSADGGSPIRLAGGVGLPYIVWSPDSTQLLLVSKGTEPAPDGALAIVRVPLDGSSTYPITNPSSNNMWPDW
jgi:TolB protein